MRAALAALVLGACVTIDGTDVLVPPMFEADERVTWQAGDAEREGTFADYLAERGGRLGAIGGTLFDEDERAVFIEEALSSVPQPGRSQTTTLELDWSFETKGEPGFAVSRALIGPPGARVATARLRAHAATGPALFVHCGGSGSDVAGTGAVTLLKTMSLGEGLVFDFPGYGASEGERTIADLDRAAGTLAAYLDEEPGPVIPWGHSFGGLVCAEIAARMARPPGVIIETSAPDARSAVRYFAPWWAAPFVRVAPDLTRYDAADALTRAGAPILVLGAGRDRMLSVRASRALAGRLAEAGADVTYAEGEDADHFDAFASEEGRAAVRAFLERLGASDDGGADQKVRLESTAERR